MTSQPLQLRILQQKDHCKRRAPWVVARVNQSHRSHPQTGPATIRTPITPINKQLPSMPQMTKSISILPQISQRTAASLHLQMCHCRCKKVSYYMCSMLSVSGNSGYTRSMLSIDDMLMLRLYKCYILGTDDVLMLRLYKCYILSTDDMLMLRLYKCYTLTTYDLLMLRLYKCYKLSTDDLLMLHLYMCYILSTDDMLMLRLYKCYTLTTDDLLMLRLYKCYKLSTDDVLMLRLYMCYILITDDMLMLWMTC